MNKFPFPGAHLLVQDHFAKYTNKLLRDRTAVPESIRFYRLDDEVTTNRNDEWLPLFTRIFAGLNITSLLFAQPTLAFADILVERAPEGTDRLIPNDSETRVFLHDLPFIRKEEWSHLSRERLGDRITNRLKERKAVIVQGLGIVATGGVTVEQAYIGFSTVFHTTFIHYLLEVLTRGFKVPGEKDHFDMFRTSWLWQSDLKDLQFASGPHQGKDAILSAIYSAGRATVEKGYVDSFFGNISYFDGKTIYISQTTSSLDELEGHIDPVPLDGSSTAGLSASSELPAHRAVYNSTDFHAILHGHPRFSIVLSMFCKEENCSIGDCNRFCNRKRSACGVPIVAGETGAGGLAKSVPLAMKESGVCIAYGHGVFSAGKDDFKDAFMKMADVEDQCRQEYFRLLGENGVV